MKTTYTCKNDIGHVELAYLEYTVCVDNVHVFVLWNYYCMTKNSVISIFVLFQKLALRSLSTVWAEVKTLWPSFNILTGKPIYHIFIKQQSLTVPRLIHYYKESPHCKNMYVAFV